LASPATRIAAAGGARHAAPRPHAPSSGCGAARRWPCRADVAFIGSTLSPLTSIPPMACAAQSGALRSAPP
jgi:hypothetical protein